MSKLLILFLTSLLFTASQCIPTSYSYGSPPEAEVRCNARRAYFLISSISYSDSQTYSTPSHLAVSQSSISFTLTNTNIASSYVMTCSGSSNSITGLDGSTDYSCTGRRVGALSGFPVKATFKFSKQTGTFSLDATWNCDRYSPYRKQKVRGVGSGTARLQCKSNSWTNPSWRIGQTYSMSSNSCQASPIWITPRISTVGE